MAICAAVFGGAACAFLPRIAHRLAVPAGEPFRSTCAHCSAAFPPGKTGWVRAGRFCACQSVPWRLVAAGAAAAALPAITLGPRPIVLAVLLAIGPGVLLAAIDLRCRRLPDPVVAVLAGLTVPVLVTVAGPGQVVRAGAGAGVCFTAYTMIAILPRAGLGFGDVKLGAVLGFVLGFAGWPALAVGVLVPHLIAGPVAVVLLATRRIGPRSALPFGPALLAGALIGVCT
ncbi:MAG: leader peptidase (prepilin peptidase) / N-methyltransferase [Actinoplanes sp.]|jgi:leader peptidase (prepilin peptidase)/N-methyltransferase|nr:leader peptidase (prepilin peptidase) / N-methyltransferase [Actinoplanes sp.]